MVVEEAPPPKKPGSWVHFVGQMSSVRKAVSKIRAAILVGFLVFSDEILSWYLGLPLAVTWTIAGVVIVLWYGVVRIMRRWPAKFQHHRDVIRNGLEQVKFSLFAFTFAGVSRVWYNLDVSLRPFYLNWGVWLMVGLQVFTLDLIATLQYPELNLSGRALKSTRWLIRRWIRTTNQLVPKELTRRLLRFARFRALQVFLQEE